MAALLPILVLGLIAAAWRRRVREPLRETLLAASIVCGLAAVGGAELLGAIGLLTRGGVLLLWTLAVAAAGVFVARRPAGQTAPRGEAQRSSAEWSLLGGIAFLLLLVGVTALAAAPNTWDALTYHLPRVRHWIQDRSLGSFPTSNLRQLTLAPGAEILLAHLRLLSGTDRLFNLVQWGAWAGAIAAASSIAARLSASSAAPIAAAAFAASLPMAILQGSSCQNDLVVAFWLLAFALFAARSLGPDGGGGSLWLAAGSLALAVATKATALIFAFPFLVWLAARLVARRGLRALGALAVGAGIVVAVNAGAWTRNVVLFDTPLGVGYGTLNDAVTPGIVISNAARNAALQLAGPGEGWNRSVEGSVAALHRALGLRIDDPRSTWSGARFRVPAGLSAEGRPGQDEAVFAMFHDGQAGNPLHLLLLAVAAAVVLGRRGVRRSPAAGYFAALAAAALLFCAVLRWQPWNARLQLPLFLLGAPLAGAALSEGKAAGWARRGSVLLLLAAFPWALVNATRPLLGPSSVLSTPRLGQYFAEIPESEPAFLAAARSAVSDGCGRIGLELRADDPEELLWMGLDRAAPGPRRVQSVGVRNRSAALSEKPPFAGFEPCAVISLEGAGAQAGPEPFSESWAGGQITVRRK
jgi:hypothetical protein